MDNATAKRNALLQRRTTTGGGNRPNGRVTRPAAVAVAAAPVEEEEEELPQAFGKGIRNDDDSEEGENDNNTNNGESGDEDDRYSPLNGPSPSPAPPRFEDPQQLLRRNNNTNGNSNPKTAIRASAIEKPKSVAAAQQQLKQQNKPAAPSSTTSVNTTADTASAQPPGSSSYLDEFIFKVCVVGNHNVGKTSLVRRMCNPITPSNNNSAGVEQILHTRPTIGVDFSSRVVENIRPGALVRMQLWDTAGLEKFAAVSAPVYRNCAGVIAVVDVLNRDTLDALVAKWLPAVLGQLPTLPLSSVLVLCNKMDLLETFTDSTKNKNGNVLLPQGVDPSKFTSAGEVSQALSNAGINDTLIMEVSAKSGQNVEEAISLLCNRIIDKIATTTGIENAATPAAEQGNAKKNKGGKLDGAEAISPNKIQNKGKLDELNEASDDDDDDDSASPKESNNAPKDTTPAVVSGGVTTRQVVSLKDVKKAEPLDTSMSSSVRSKKSNATYCPC